MSDEIRVSKRPAREAGSCYACDGMAGQVFEIRSTSTSGSMSITSRWCAKHLAEIVQQARAQGFRTPRRIGTSGA